MSTTVVTYECEVCGTTPSHPVIRCPRVREVEFYENGQIKRVVKK